MTSNDELTMSIQATSKLRRYGKLCKQYVTGLYPRYRKLNVGGKLSLSDENPLLATFGSYPYSASSGSSSYSMSHFSQR